MNELQNPTSWERESGSEGDIVLESNWLFELRRERFRSRSSGKDHAFYVIRLPDAVNVIAITEGNEILLVRQFRAGSATDSLETPGGLLDPGENPLEAGARELREETGYQGDPPVLIGSAYANPSLLTAKTFTILIRNAKSVAKPDLDPGEELVIERYPIQEVPQMIAQGRFDHSLTIMGLLWWLARGNGIVPVVAS